MGNKLLHLTRATDAAPARSRPIWRSRWTWGACLAVAALIFVLARDPVAAVLFGLTGLAVVAARQPVLPALRQADTLVVVGGGPIAAVLAEVVRARSGARHRILSATRNRRSIVRTATLADAESLIRTTTCDEVILADAGQVTSGAALLRDVRGRRVALVSGADVLERHLGRLPLELLADLPQPIQMNQDGAAARSYVIAKRALDLAIATALGLIVLPILPMIALAIWLDSPGSPFFSQTRLGEAARPFLLRKFRTMGKDAEPNGAVWAQPDDPRVTRVGRFLRSTRLDELPQLWNVLRGEMSLVGPRPERPEFMQLLEQEVPAFALRTMVKPGLTGWAQICFRYSRSVSDARTKLEYDLYYVRHASLRFDLRILIRTIGVVLHGQGS